MAPTTWQWPVASAKWRYELSRAIICNHLKYMLRPSDTTMEFRRYDPINRDRMEERFRARNIAPP